MERQIHGFIYEDKVCKNFNLIANQSYISEYDATTVSGTPIQIKCIKNKNEICLGDYFRNKKKSKDFYFIIGFWENSKTNIVKEDVLYIPYKEWNDMFVFENDDDITTLLKEISNNYSDDLIWKTRCKKIKQSWNGCDRIIQLRFKRDHKKQKRIQVAIPYKKYEKWKTKFIQKGITP